MSTEPEKEDRGDDFAPDEAPLTESLEAPPEAPPEAPAPEPEATPPAEPPAEPFVPHSRFEELNQRLKLERESRLDLEARLNEVLRQEEARKTPPFDPQAVEKDYLKAVLEGDIDRASTLMSAIRAHERQQMEAHMLERTRREVAQAQARTALETVAETAMQQYPFLDPNHASANPAAIAEVVEWRDYYLVAKHMTPAKALQQAVSRVAPGYAKGEPSPPSIASRSDRTTQQRQTNAQTAAQQPPLLGGVGARAQRQATPDIAKMSDAEFAALPAAERAKLRGDVAA